MKKSVILLSLVSFVLLANDTVQLPLVEITESINTKIVKNVSSEEIKSADLAEALEKNIASISLVRRSGIANDIILRGQKRDNINVTIDGAKIYGACPNRMDPPTSHILTNNVNEVIVQEGPFDVEDFGVLSGSVKIKTKKPTKELKGEVNINVGSFSYKKASATISGGNKSVQGLLSISSENGDQYKDGAGNTLSQQADNYSNPMNKYKTKYKEMRSFEKKTLLGKVNFNINDNHNILLSYTANRSDSILYSNTPMDALYDDSDIFTLNYTALNLSSFSKEFNINLYNSKVDHPMSTKFRNASGANAFKEVINDLSTSTSGAKIKNSMDIKNTVFTYGLDMSKRNWDGEFKTIGMMAMHNGKKSIDDVDTTNKALFIKASTKFDKLALDYGLRYDKTDIDTASNLQDNDYKSLSGNIFAIYNVDDSLRYFAGIGKSARVPDARELYFYHFKNNRKIGTPTLNQTKNYEIDLGFEKVIGDFSVKTKVFYSKLKDYIYYNSKLSKNNFENIDAKIYGLEVSGLYFINDNFTFDYSLAYQRGKKDKVLKNQSDKDLADINPLKMNLGLTYEQNKHLLKVDVQASDSWDKFDSDNGEQKLSGYALLNLKYNNKLSKNFDITFGMDNVFDKNYASSNTYKDLTLISAGGSDTMLLNNPGRYIYTNIRYRF